MAYEFRLRLFTPAGVPIGESTDFLDLACDNFVNEVGNLIVDLRPESFDPNDIALNAQVHLDWRDVTLDFPWTPFFRGINRKQSQRQPQAKVFTLTAVGLNWLLKTRINAFYAGVQDRTYFTFKPAETIMKTMVKYNLTSLATTGNGRLRSAGTSWPASQMTVEADALGGTTQSWRCAHVQLLDNLQKLVKIAGGDFAIEPLGTGYVFKFYPGQLGDDLTSTVVFSVENGNMANPEYTKDHLDEATVAIVGGQGEESARQFTTRTGGAFSSSNDIEVFVPATDVPTSDLSSLWSRGDEAMVEHRAAETFTFEVLQTKNSRLGIHYNVGDLVTAVNPITGAASVQKVVGAELGFDESTPVVTAYVRTP